MQKIKLLVVDDEAGMRHSINRALNGHRFRPRDVESELRFEVSSVASGPEALERIAIQPPDIMLLDHQLGGMTGIDVLGKLATQPRDFLTIMITAFATIETAVRATKSGAFDFLAKPFTPEELKETVEKAAAHLMVQREARRLASEKRRVRFEFISVLAHELKSPLNAVDTYLHLVKDGGKGNDLSAYGEVFGRCLARIEGMRKLIDDLLDLTRIESGERRRELQDVDVASIARTAIEAVAPAAVLRGVTVRLRGGEQVTMTADRGELEIVLNNLVSNAVKYNREDGNVDVRLSADERTVTIEVTDTGIGLSPPDCERIFNDFVRIPSEKTRAIPGSGLGLSTVRKIAQLYRGTATVRSEEGVGSTFRVTLERHSPLPEPDRDSRRDAELVA